MKKSTFKRVLTLATALVLVFSVVLSVGAIEPEAPYYFTDPELQLQTPMGNETIFDAEYMPGINTYLLVNQPEYYTRNPGTPQEELLVGEIVGYTVLDETGPSPVFVDVWSKGYAFIPGELIINDIEHGTEYFIVMIYVSIFNITTKTDEGIQGMPGYLDVSKLPQ